MHEIESQGVSGRGPAAGEEARRGRDVRTLLAAVPAGLVALLPKAACPVCWPVYAGTLSALGLGFLLKSAWMVPLTGLFLAVAVGTLAVRARRRWGYGPVALGLVGAVAILMGKFVLESDLSTHGGLALLLGATLWNAWPRRRASTTSCSACASRAEHVSS